MMNNRMNYHSKNERVPAAVKKQLVGCGEAPIRFVKIVVIKIRAVMINI